MEPLIPRKTIFSLRHAGGDFTKIVYFPAGDSWSNAIL